MIDGMRKVHRGNLKAVLDTVVSHQVCVCGGYFVPGVVVASHWV